MTEQPNFTYPKPPPGWYPDPEQPGQRWWDGTAWGPQAPHQRASAPYPAPVSLPPEEKSSGVAVLLTILWPGGGHLYLGLSQKAIPHVVANAIGLVLAFTIILFPIALLIWVVTLCMTVGSVSRDTEVVNEARRQGRRVIG